MMMAGRMIAFRTVVYYLITASAMAPVPCGC
jgi:hypothetical protein